MLLQIICSSILKTIDNYGNEELKLAQVHLAYEQQRSLFENFSTILSLVQLDSNIFPAVKAQIEKAAKNLDQLEMVSLFIFMFLWLVTLTSTINYLIILYNSNWSLMHFPYIFKVSFTRFHNHNDNTWILWTICSYTLHLYVVFLTI